MRRPARRVSFRAPARGSDIHNLVTEIVVPGATLSLIEDSGVPQIMQQIRPQWQAKGLIDRVRRLLPVDPSSACQRLLNAAIADLREKIKIAGLDIAKETAQSHSLPPVNRGEDIDNYSTARTLDLSYRMGLLTRPEWRRMTRAYDIRRDLEHEDSEYEAGIEDVVYIFTVCIEAVLSKDPVTLIKVTEIKDVVEAPGPAVADERLIEDYEHAPDRRQVEILKMLLSVSLDDKQPDLVRSNAFAVIGALAACSRDAVIVEVARHMQDQVGRRALTELEVRVAQQANLYPYLRKAQKRAFFSTVAAELEGTSYGWRSNNAHGTLLRSLIDVGGLTAVPVEDLAPFVKWLTLCYLGEPGGYGAGRGRPVFYSNSGAPLARRLLEAAPDAVRPVLVAVGKDKDVRAARKRDQAIDRRYEELLDAVEPKG